MKKVIVGVISALVLVTLTGCGATKEKTLKCTSSNVANDIETKSVMEFTFKGNEATKISLDLTIEYPEKYASYGETFKKTLEGQKPTLEKVGYEVELSAGDTYQKLSAVGTNKTLKESEYKGDIEATKKSYEKQGYTCE